MAVLVVKTTAMGEGYYINLKIKRDQKHELDIMVAGSDIV